MRTPTTSTLSCCLLLCFELIYLTNSAHRENLKSNTEYNTIMSCRVVVTAPPGRLGLRVVDAEADEVHTVVSRVDDEGPLAGQVFGGDQIVAVNGIDVQQKNAAGKR